jgi:periplasmic protein CpxP/Spy
MKKIILGFLLLAGISIGVNAQKQQGKQGKHQRHKQQRAMMMQKLNLSPAQQEQVKANRTQLKQQMAELNKNENITVKEFRDRKAAIRKEQKAKMESLLTPDQKQQLATEKAAMQQKRQAKSAQRMDKMKAKIGLSDEQVSRIKTNRESIQIKAKAIKDNPALDRSAKKEQLAQLKKQQQENMQKVLTNEQKEKLATLKKQQKGKRSISK